MLAGYAGASVSVCIYPSVVLSWEVPVWVHLYPCASLRVFKTVCFSVCVGMSPRNLPELSKCFSTWAGCRSEKLMGLKVLSVPPEAEKG